MNEHEDDRMCPECGCLWWQCPHANRLHAAAQTIRNTDTILYTAEIDALHDRVDVLDALIADNPPDDGLTAARAECVARLAHLEQPALPGAETVRETENATPAYDAPFSLTPKVAPAIPPRALRLFNNRHED